jgi:hypothetical protein
MKKLLSIISLALIVPLLQAQNMDFLDINQVKAGFWADGTMFWDKVSDPLFEWPKDSGTHISFATGLWVGGLNSGHNLQGAYKRYGTNGNDFYTGPLTLATASVDSSTMALYNRVWKLNKTEVDQFRQCYCENPGLPQCAGYTIPASISLWPGNPIAESDGDHLLMDQQLAPYYDSNVDGVYDPVDCDYPLIKCDQSLFFVFNDKGGFHEESATLPVGIEVRALAYACACDTLQQAINNSIFLDLKVIHRGTDTLYQTYFSLFNDGGVGGPMDDYIGTDVESGYIYHYNGDGFDEDLGATQGYGNLPPAHGIVFLQGPYMDANGVDDDLSGLVDIVQYQDTTTLSNTYSINGTGFNDGIPDNEKLGLTRSIRTAIPGDPILGNQNYLLQKSYWMDSTAQIYGGNGYPGGLFVSASRARFIYPNDSDADDWGTSGIATVFPWTEFNTGATANIPGDRQILGSTGPFTLEPGEINTLSFAFVTARSTNPADSLSRVALHEAVVNIKANYELGLASCTSAWLGNEEQEQAPQVLIYPNPAHDWFWISTEQLGNSTLLIHDMTGRLMSLVNTTANQTSMAIPIETLAPGMYTLTISNAGWKRSMRFICQ